MADPTETLCCLEATAARKDARHGSHADGFEIRSALLLTHDAATQMDEHFGNVDFDGADFVAGSA